MEGRPIGDYEGKESRLFLFLVALATWRPLISHTASIVILRVTQYKFIQGLYRARAAM